ncbi:hypothetical protein [Kribbella sp. NPDC006257]|uniref:hypothetical protein n=1 Tax=Kribbella sp. NPDC006257 TaxID=3156738 RepID=UPI0033B5D21F
MNNQPQIQGYQFDQLLLEHPLAEIWHGRSFTGMEVVGLFLSTTGAADPQVRERLGESSRGAALTPGDQETPLWAANFNSDRPYAITQLIPGQSGAERLLDPLDGLLGNDEESLAAVRSRLTQYGAVPLPVDSPQPVSGKVELAREYSKKLGTWVYAVVVLVVLIVFTVTYSIGAAVGSAVKKDSSSEPVAAPVKPAALPSQVLLPGIAKVSAAPHRESNGGPSLVGETYSPGVDLQIVSGIDLPFSIGWPRPPETRKISNSSTTLYRLIQTQPPLDQSSGSDLIARIAVRQCSSLGDCLAKRAAFDQDWTKVFRVQTPRTAKDARTWFTVSNTTPYTLTMTTTYSNAGRWWLVGASVTSTPDEVPSAQQVLNDIWHQTT